MRGISGSDRPPGQLSAGIRGERAVRSLLDLARFFDRVVEWLRHGPAKPDTRVRFPPRSLHLPVAAVRRVAVSIQPARLGQRRKLAAASTTLRSDDHATKKPGTGRAISNQVRPAPNQQTQQQTGVPFIIMQQLQPAFIIAVMQSQHAWIISAAFASPLVQVMVQPILVISHLARAHGHVAAATSCRSSCSTCPSCRPRASCTAAAS